MEKFTDFSLPFLSIPSASFFITGANQRCENVPHCLCPIRLCGHSKDVRLICLIVLRCQVLSPPADGKLESGVCANVYGSICRMQCNKGYELNGSVARTCDKIAGTNQVHWTGNSTSCRGKKQDSTKWFIFTIKVRLLTCAELVFRSVNLGLGVCFFVCLFSFISKRSLSNGDGTTTRTP